MNKKTLLQLLLVFIFMIIFILAFYLHYRINNERMEGFDDNQNTSQDIPTDGIPDGYYKISDTKMAKVPYGYKVNSTKDGLLAASQAAFWADYAKNYDKTYGNVDLLTQEVDGTDTKYNNNNYDITYHDSPEDIQKQGGLFDASFGTVMVIDPYGNKLLIPYNPAQSLPIYYTPGTYKYGSSTYVPSYEDSVYLSKMTFLSELYR
jgi:hypothetical protein